jgi:hypothetical protein
LKESEFPFVRFLFPRTVRNPRHAAADFDGESEAERLARRKRNWIGQVEMDGSGE